MVAEGVEPHPACVAADQVAPHRRAVCPLRGAGVPALRHRCPQRVQQLVIQRGDFLLGVADADVERLLVRGGGEDGVLLSLCDIRITLADKVHFMVHGRFSFKK